MDSNLLKVFVTVANKKSISKAANSLKYAQSNVTSRIKQLEKNLDCKLFHRVPSGVILTHEGERLYPHAVEIIRKIEVALLDMKDMLKQEQLIVASTESNAVTRIVNFLLKLHTDFQDLQLELITNTTAEIKKMLMDYKVDRITSYNVCYTKLLRKDKKRVVVVGGGFGGATAAKYMKKFSPETEVILIEQNKEYYTCPFV